METMKKHMIVRQFKGGAHERDLARLHHVDEQEVVQLLKDHGLAPKGETRLNELRPTVESLIQQGLSMREMAQHTGASYEDIRKIVGTRHRAYTSGKGGFAQRFTDKSLISAVQQAAKDLNAPRLTRDAYEEYRREHGGPASLTIVRRFDKWSTAMTAAGLETEIRERKRTSEQACIDALRAAYDRLGELPSMPAYQRLWKESLKAEGHPSASTIRVHLGSWKKGLVHLDQDRQIG